MRTTCLLLALAVVASAAAQEPKDKGAKEELAKLEGTWRLVSGEIDGHKVPQEDMGGWEMDDRSSVVPGRATGPRLLALRVLMVLVVGAVGGAGTGF
jgi:hypothetical protein